jgi:DNA-binding protein HU-beta
MTTAAKRMSKAQVIAELAEKTGLGKKEVQSVFDQLMALAERELGKNGPGEFVLPDMVKLRVKMTPAQPEQKVINPFTKEEQMRPARPESRKVRASPVKRLKDLVG